MPLLLEGRVAGRNSPGERDAAGPERRKPENQWLPTLEIGLVNNMPDAALRATERQFIDLLGAAAGDTVVRLHLLALPQLPRGAAVRARLRSSYADLQTLQTERLDGLIVTGSEPVSPSLADEPYWQALTELVDWAEHNTISTIWSCLAAHAAVLHLDGIGRHRLAQKRFGLFGCVKAADHPLLDGLSEPLWMPHSRWNDLAASELQAHGYDLLTMSPEAGVDMFAKQWKSLFVFFQGHPEYGIDTLFREYRRDMTRYLRGERDSVPGLPAHYFDARSETALARFAGRAEAQRAPEAVARLPDYAVIERSVQAWRSAAVRIYRNWLAHLRATKTQ